MLNRNRFHPIAMLVLAWFICYVAASIASPFIAPQHIVQVCGEGGHLKSIVVDSNGEEAAPAPHQLHCPLCLLCAFGPPATFKLAPETPHFWLRQNLGYTSQTPRWLGAPLPPRGPPPAL